jgi:hypothetical protein
MAKGSQYRLVFQPPLSPEQTAYFKQQVKDYALGEDGEVWVRYPGALSDLIDTLEESFEKSYALQSSTLGLARFKGTPP